MAGEEKVEVVAAWAETVVSSASNPYPPVDGEECANCNYTFARGDRAFKLTSLADNQWVCPRCAGEPDNEPMGA